MLSWISRHRPRRRGAKKTTPTADASPSKTSVDVMVMRATSSAVSQRPPEFRLRHQDTDATLVDRDDLDGRSDSETSFFEPDSKIPLKRCTSPDSFDSLPIKKETAPRRAVKTSANPDDPSVRKKSQLQRSDTDLQCFGPVLLDCEPSVEVPRSKWSKIASGTTHSVATILEAFIVVGEASNIPYLKGIAGIILLVSNSVEATEENRVSCTRLAQMVFELASVAARHLEENGDSHRFSLGIQGLTRAFARILQALQTCTKRSYTRRFIESANDANLLAECEKELQQCLNIFQIRSHISTSVAFKRKDTADEVFKDQVAEVLLPVKALLARAVPEIHDTLEVPEASDEAVDIPAMPQIFYGRDSELFELTRLFSQSQQAHAVLMGQGGAGKSSLCKALMHRPEMQQKFRQRRFFVNCNSAKRSADLIPRLASAMGFPDIAEETKASGYKETIYASLACSEIPCLIVFDDINDAWDPPTTRLEIEDFLTELSNIPKVSLLITLRGTQRPVGPAYTKPYPAPLGPISAEAARQTFFAISDLPEDGEDAPLVDVLLHMVGFLPLPITLLGQLAQYEPLPFLLERYREEGTSMLYDGDVSVEASIEASLYSARVSECPAALEVLGILARFPEGTLKTEVTKLVVGGGRLPTAMVTKSLSVLHMTSLAVVVPRDAATQERLKVPDVVRTYLERHVLDGGRFRSTVDL